MQLLRLDTLHSGRRLGNWQLVALRLLMVQVRDLLWAHHRGLRHLRLSRYRRMLPVERRWWRWYLLLYTLPRWRLRLSLGRYRRRRLGLPVAIGVHLPSDNALMPELLIPMCGLLALFQQLRMGCRGRSVNIRRTGNFLARPRNIWKRIFETAVVGNEMNHRQWCQIDGSWSS